MENKQTPTEVLKQLVHQRTYAKTKDNGKKETREETVNRCRDMHVRKYPFLKESITEAFKQVHLERVVPSMRSLQFGGEAVEKANARIFNCAYAALTKWEDFSDLFYLLMCGTGTGYSVQRHHVAHLPKVKFSAGSKDVFQVPDDKEGWADALKTLLAKPSTTFDMSLVRKKGAPLSSGGTASGPEALVKTLEEVRKILSKANGRKLTTLECHDIMCYVADGVVVGGVRRAALVCLFSHDDIEMLTCKHGSWWERNPQRARANNSATLLRSAPPFKKQLKGVLKKTTDSNCGEPGVFLTNDLNMGGNPCMEIALRDGQLGNLTEVNVAACNTFEEFERACWAATFIGTLQASYTNFSYIQDKWKKNCDEEALLGVSLTGQAQKWEDLQSWVLRITKLDLIKATNVSTANAIGVQPAARLTTTKPSGSTSAWLGTTSGIHAAHSKFYIRRVRVGVDDPIAELLKGSRFVQPDAFNPANVVVSLPLAAPEAITRSDETAEELLNRAKFIYSHWIQPGHVSGANSHNVSLTVSYKEQEVGGVMDWMVENSDHWAGVSLLPYDGGTYIQAPFEEISGEVYALLVSLFDIPDLAKADYTNKVDERLGEIACTGGSCELV